jgi:hypothetical protein
MVDNNSRSPHWKEMVTTDMRVTDRTAKVR